MISSALIEAVSGRSVLVSESGIEPLQLVSRVGNLAFLLGGSRHGEAGQGPSGPDPYELLSSSLAACTATALRLYADRKRIPLVRLQVAVAFLHGEGNDKHVFERRIFLEGTLDDDQRAALMRVAEGCPIARVLAPCGEVRTFIGLSPASYPFPATVSGYMNDVAQEWWEL